MDEFTFFTQEIPAGVHIPLRPLSTQLVFTVIMAISELLFVSAVLVFHALAECRVLSRGKALSVRSHSRRIRFIQLLALIMFLTTESLVSVFTGEYDRVISSDQECVSTFARNSSSFGEINGPEFETITSSCLRLSLNQTISVSNGNFSLDSGTVRCSNEPIFWYQNAKFVPESFGEGDHRKCSKDFCVGMLSRGKSVFFTVPLSPNETFEAPVQGMWTNLSNDTSALLEGMTEQLLSMYASGFFIDSLLRRVLFSDSAQGQCNMIDSSRRETLLPLWILILAAIMWAVSVIVFIGSRFIKSRVFYDMRNPSHWAKKTSRVTNDLTEKDTAYVGLRGSGSDAVVVVTSKEGATGSAPLGVHTGSQSENAA